MLHFGACIDVGGDDAGEHTFVSDLWRCIALRVVVDSRHVCGESIVEVWHL